jgi:hypothetical protein
VHQYLPQCAAEEGVAARRELFLRRPTGEICADFIRDERNEWCLMLNAAVQERERGRGESLFFAKKRPGMYRDFNPRMSGAGGLMLHEAYAGA